MSKLSVLVPYRPDGGHRDRIWAWLLQRWTGLHPYAEMIIAADYGGATPGEFNHPYAINRAAEHATGDVFLIADCDTAANPVWITEAWALVADGVAPWVLPRRYVKVNRRQSDWILGGSPGVTIHVPPSAEEWVGDSICWSGLVMVPRAAFEEVGGYDERFAWWGADDVAFGLTMDALHGRHVRLQGSAFHLWHPQPHADTHHPHTAGQNALVERYKAAAGDPSRIRELRFS